MSILIFIFLTLLAVPVQTKEIVLLIHGTWAHKKNAEHWYNPDGYFFDIIEKQLKKENTVLVTFLWSGGNSPQARESAARVLAKTIESYNNTDVINIIAHSHGATVGILASQYLAKNPSNKHRISQFYSLGRPVNNKECQPNMDVIDYFYNFFSYNDAIQRVFGAYEREILPTHHRIANLRIVVNGKDPNHSELHAPCIAQWIYTIHDLLCLNETFEFSDPGVLYFSDTQPPTYAIDIQREALREYDRRLNNAIVHAFKIGKYKLARNVLRSGR